FGRPVRLNRVELLCHSRPHGEAPDVYNDLFSDQRGDPLYYCRTVLLPREDHPWTDDADSRRLWPGRIRAHFLYRTLPVAGVLQGCRRTSDDISLGHRRGASALHETAAHQTHLAVHARSGVSRP